MSTKAAAIRTAITVLTAQLAIEEGKPANSYLPLFDTDEAERKRLAEIAESIKPHAWRDPGPGVPITDVGDNDPPDDDLLRAFSPFMSALTRATDPIQLDSAGERFYLPAIKRRAGIGPASWGTVRDEIRAKWFSPWGVAWRTNEANIAAGLVPKPQVVDALFSKVYG